MEQRQIAVIGLGQFGRGITDTFIKLKHDVLVIDKKERLVSDYKGAATHAIVADATEENRLKIIGLANFDYVIVTIGKDIQASILTTLILKDLGVKHVYVKALNENHAKILTKIGADFVISPEKMSAKKTVKQLLHHQNMDFIELSDQYSIVDVKMTDYLTGCSIKTMDLRGKYGLSLIGIKHDGHIEINPNPNYKIKKNDKLMILGENTSIHTFKKRCLS